jgi:histidine ammonia-lyase
VKTVTIKSSGITFADVIAISRENAKVEISSEALARMQLSRNQVDALAQGEIAVYGISTGFGALANRHIDPADRVQLQKSLIRSHAAGMGPFVEKEVVRALMTLRL